MRTVPLSDQLVVQLKLWQIVMDRHEQLLSSGDDKKTIDQIATGLFRMMPVKLLCWMAPDWGARSRQVTSKRSKGFWRVGQRMAHLRKMAKISVTSVAFG